MYIKYTSDSRQCLEQYIMNQSLSHTLIRELSEFYICGIFEYYFVEGFCMLQGLLCVKQFK